jgi:CRP/FNR family transcriptional regulator, anaerobic regulatory protein
MGAFVERVTRRFSLDLPEIAFLEALEAFPIPVRRGQIIAEEGDPAVYAFVLISGWITSCTRFPDGSHQVRRLHFPGDLLAMPSIPMRHHAEDLEALSDGLIAPFPRVKLSELFTMPRLAAIMYMFAQAERITAGDRLASLGHDSAKKRIAFLLIDILHRLRSADCSVTNSFYMHLTREEIAHVTGMTPVHASRMWTRLIADRLIHCVGRQVTIVDESQLAAIGHYVDRDGDFDFDWLKLVGNDRGLLRNPHEESHRPRQAALLNQIPA